MPVNGNIATRVRYERDIGIIVIFSYIQLDDTLLQHKLHNIALAR